jgi:hypothetical protein
LKSLLDANGCVSEVEAATIMRGVLDMLVELHRCVVEAGGPGQCKGAGFGDWVALVLPVAVLAGQHMRSC